MKTMSVQKTELTAISGVGSSTAESIEEQTGIDDARELAIAYCTNRGAEIKSVLRRPKSFIRTISEMGIPNEELGVYRTDVNAAQVMAFIQTFGTNEMALLDSIDESEYDETKIGQPNQMEGGNVTPDMVDWDAGSFLNQSGEVGFVTEEWLDEKLDYKGNYKPEAVSEIKTDNFTDHVQFETGEVKSVVSGKYRDMTEVLFGYDMVEQSDRIKINGEGDDWPILAENTCGEMNFLIAPRIASL